jgi:hypothetical protein
MSSCDVDDCRARIGMSSCDVDDCRARDASVYNITKVILNSQVANKNI